LRTRTAPTAFQWVKGHSGDEGNEKADRLAETGAKRDVPDIIDLSIPPRFDIQGAKMSALTQRIAYQGIMEQRQKQPRRSTARNLDKMRYAVEEISGHLENNGTLWGNCQRKDLRKKVQQFIVKAIHEAFKIGAYWRMIPGYEERSVCRLCQDDATETMEHILLQCRGSHQRMLWQQMRRIWPEKHGPCPTITLGTILGCGSTGSPMSDGRPTKEEATKITEEKAGKRLLRVLVSETAYLIWLLRCESVIGERNSGEDAAKTRWRAQISERRMVDYLTATRLSRSKVHSMTLHNTWKYINIQDEQGPRQLRTTNTCDSHMVNQSGGTNIARTGEHEVFSG
jgi:hypothetical protein